MSAVWVIPVAPPVDRVATMPRRVYREQPSPMPRDARPSRARRERMPEALRVEGAASRIRD